MIFLENFLNKLKKKVESLTKVVQALIKEVQHNASLAQGTLTAFQLHIGEEEWNKVIAELQDREKRRTKEKKLDLDAEKLNFEGEKLRQKDNIDKERIQSQEDIADLRAEVSLAGQRRQNGTKNT